MLLKKQYINTLISREVSLLGRKEVLTGKAKFGIFGDGKEVAQIAMAKAFKEGDWRSGYYRDQTFMMAINAFSAEEFFTQGRYSKGNTQGKRVDWYCFFQPSDLTGTNNSQSTVRDDKNLEQRRRQQANRPRLQA